jgi:N-acetylglutamate synthase-like GNAT family acetyltransferase
MSIRVRLAENSDNESILELAKRCPQKGMITFYPSRAPNFNGLQRLIDEGAWHYIAQNENRIIGLVGVVHFYGEIGDKMYKIGYMHDLRVEPEFRNGLTAFRLVKTAIDHLQNSDVDMVIVNFLKDNKLPLVFTSGRAGIPVSHYLGDNLVFNIIPLRFKPISSRFEIDEAKVEDIPEMIDLYNRYSRSFKLSPAMSEERFRRLIDQVKGLDLSHFLLAREDGRLKAMTAVWDEGPYRTYNVLRLNMPLRIVNSLLRFFNYFMRVPHPIENNQPIKQLSLVLYGHEDCPEALDALFRHVNNINLGSEYSFLTVYLQESDPLVTYLKRFSSITVKSEMYMFAKDTSLFNKLNETNDPVLFDLSMII